MCVLTWIISCDWWHVVPVCHFEPVRYRKVQDEWISGNRNGCKSEPCPSNKAKALKKLDLWPVLTVHYAFCRLLPLAVINILTIKLCKTTVIYHEMIDLMSLCIHVWFCCLFKSSMIEWCTVYWFAIFAILFTDIFVKIVSFYHVVTFVECHVGNVSR